MVVKLIQMFKVHRSFILSAILLILFISLGIIGYSKLERMFIVHNPSILHTIRLIVFISIILYGLLQILVQWFVNKASIRPVKKVLNVGNKIAGKEMNSLSNAIAELSQGDLSRQLKPGTKSIPHSNQVGLNQVIDIFNHMIQNLNDAYQAFNNITNIPCKRLFYVGADSFLEGRRCGELMGQCLNGKGQIILTAESFSNTNLDLRRRGFLSTIREKYPDIEVIATLDATAAQGIAYKIAQDILKKYPKISGIYVASGSSPSHFARAIVEADKADQIKIICHDLLDDTMKYVKSGAITATLSQNSLAQGHDPVVHMYNHLASGWEPLMPYLLTESEEVNISNYQSFWREGEGVILSDEAKNKLAKPLDSMAAKPLRIAVLGRDDTAFWKSIKRGVEEAINTLRDHPVVIDWIVPDEVRKIHRLTAEVYGPAMEKIIKNRYNGLVTMASDHDFIPYINKAVDEGIPVGLYNSDPTSLRGLIFTISTQAQHLMGLSETLADSTYQSNQATIKIQSAMDTVAQSTRSQNSQVSKTNDVLKSLLEAIDFIRQDTENSYETTIETIKTVLNGTEAMNNTLKTVQAVEKSVSATWNIVEDLSKHSKRIDAVVDLIDDIASRVNVLALNAAIEATKAGKYGKGFMVVAKEIRALAKKTADATREVALLINTVQSDIARVDTVMSDGLNKLKQTSELTDDAMQAISDIKQRVENDKQRISDIVDAMNDMQNSSLNVGAAMEYVGLESQKNMQAVEEVSDLTKDMITQLENVSKLAQSLETMAKGEQEMLAKFSLMQSN